MKENYDRALRLLAEIQPEQGEWQRKNFPNADSGDAFAGIVEEVGELSHAILKRSQGIRGKDHLDKISDAIGDILIYGLAYLNKIGLNLSDVLRVCATHNLRTYYGASKPERPTWYIGLIAAGSLPGLLECNDDGSPNGYKVSFAFLQTVTYLDNVADYYGLSICDCIIMAWNEVKVRDWTKYPENGVDK